MLDKFTWQDFLIAAFILSVIWYAVVIALFYRREAWSLIIKEKESGPEPNRFTDEEPNSFYHENNEEVSLIGKPKMPDGLENLEMTAFGFGSNDKKREQQIGLVADVMEEIKAAIELISESDGTKADLIELLSVVKEKYPQISDHPNFAEIKAYVVENAAFDFTQEELQNLWN